MNEQLNTQGREICKFLLNTVISETDIKGKDIPVYVEVMNFLNQIADGKIELMLEGENVHPPENLDLPTPPDNGEG